VRVINLARHNSRTGLCRPLVAFVLLCFSLTIALSPVWGQEPAASPAPTGDASTGTPSGVGIQAASAVATILYFPFKAAFAIGGGIVGGLAYAFSGGSEQTAKNIWIPSMYGTYIITPEHLKGDKPVRFLGVPADPTRESTEPSSQEPAPLPLEPIR
jgi:hypothetical protein